MKELIERMMNEGKERYKIAAQAQLRAEEKSNWYVNEKGELECVK